MVQQRTPKKKQKSNEPLDNTKINKNVKNKKEFTRRLKKHCAIKPKKKDAKTKKIFLNIRTFGFERLGFPVSSAQTFTIRSKYTKNNGKLASCQF